MADNISQVVEVNISRETAQIDTASFNIPLLVVNLPDTIDNTDPDNPVNVPADVTNRVQVFTSATEVADTFGDDSIAYQMAQKLMSGQLRPAQFMIGVKNSSETYTQAMNAIAEYNNDWFMVSIDSKVSGDIKEVAAVIQATEKMFGASTADADVIDPAATDDIGSFLKDAGYDHTFIVYHTQAATLHPEVAWIGSQIVETPGSNTWAFKTASGVTVDRLSSTATTALQAKNVNFYTRLGGVNMFRTGCTCLGEWIDVLVGVLWLQARLREQVFFRIATKKKIPMEQKGAMMIEAEIRSVLSQGVANGLIAEAPQFQVTSPDVLSIPEVQRNQRRMEGFKFTARLAGAVHYVRIDGSVFA